MQYQVIAYKVDCGYCGTDSYDFGVVTPENVDQYLHEAALEHDNSYGFEEEEAQELIDEGMEEDEAWEASHARKEERVCYEYRVLHTTEDEKEADEVYKHFRETHCPSEFIQRDY